MTTRPRVLTDKLYDKQLDEKGVALRYFGKSGDREACDLIAWCFDNLVFVGYGCSRWVFAHPHRLMVIKVPDPSHLTYLVCQMVEWEVCAGHAPECYMPRRYRPYAELEWVAGLPILLQEEAAVGWRDTQQAEERDGYQYYDYDYDGGQFGVSTWDGRLIAYDMGFVHRDREWYVPSHPDSLAFLTPRVPFGRTLASFSSPSSLL